MIRFFILILAFSQNKKDMSKILFLNIGILEKICKMYHLLIKFKLVVLIVIMENIDFI